MRVRAILSKASIHRSFDNVYLIKKPSVSPKAIIAHERLSIVDPESGGQPLLSKDKKLILGVNGEIYNHRELREKYKDSYEFQTGSDCEVILALYRDKKEKFIDDMDFNTSPPLPSLEICVDITRPIGC